MLGFAMLLIAVPSLAQDASRLSHQKIELLAPPFVHSHQQATTEGPKIIEFRLVVQEKTVVIDDIGTTLQAMTFDGSIPGPLMVVHEGDYVELALVNPKSNSMPHNLDFHAATGGLGGGTLTLINPGEQVVLRFKATRAGVFIYHCAPGGTMIPWHVVSGMSGAIMVLPRSGLKDGAGNALHYDRVYYIGENDFYIPRSTNGKFKSYNSLGDDYNDMIQAMRGLIPTHVVFNGKVGALTGKNAEMFRQRRRAYERQVEAVFQQGIESGDFRPLDTRLAVSASQPSSEMRRPGPSEWICTRSSPTA